jgi:hypothetical protein
LLVIPAKAEALYSSEAGQSSFNTTREALDIGFMCCAQRISLDPGLRRDDEQNVGICQGANPNTPCAYIWDVGVCTPTYAALVLNLPASE